MGNWSEAGKAQLPAHASSTRAFGAPFRRGSPSDDGGSAGHWPATKGCWITGVSGRWPATTRRVTTTSTYRWYMAGLRRT